MKQFVTFSKSLTIPLTRACSNACLYCGFRQGGAGLITKEELDRLVWKAREEGYWEALLMSGERPEEKEVVREELRASGFDTFVHFARDVAARMLREELLPHSNLGCLSFSELNLLSEVNASMGLMLENIDQKFGKKVHPEKNIEARLSTIENAGRLKIPLTTGILIGLGESQKERLESLEAIGYLANRYGHIQEVIIQPYVPNKGSGIASVPAGFEEVKGLVKYARASMPEVAVQIPPNLCLFWRELVPFGAGDLGGISDGPDLINPARPWQEEKSYARSLGEMGYLLQKRLPIYERFYKKGWYSEKVGKVIGAWIEKRGFGHYLN